MIQVACHCQDFGPAGPLPQVTHDHSGEQLHSEAVLRRRHRREFGGGQGEGCKRWPPVTLRSGQIRRLQLTDIHDGQLHLPGRTILLAQPVRVRLAAYLHHRNRRWPPTANPHLFIYYRTALRLDPVGARWLAIVLGTAARIIRTDRILDEVLAAGGDLRRICDLFGLSVKAASRYTAYSTTRT